LGQICDKSSLERRVVLVCLGFASTAFTNSIGVPNP
jgi:hypothetical protein